MQHQQFPLRDLEAGKFGELHPGLAHFILVDEPVAVQVELFEIFRHVQVLQVLRRARVRALRGQAGQRGLPKELRRPLRVGDPGPRGDRVSMVAHTAICWRKWHAAHGIWNVEAPQHCFRRDISDDRRQVVARCDDSPPILGKPRRVNAACVRVVW